ncbi:MAG: phage terminase large subunit family protein, partial [Achromobacter sp.]|nr:phage terminase large subunit family protein [Achromobacter sp.]
PGQFADQKIKGGARRRSARLWVPNVHKIKNMIDARLRRNVPGPGYVHLPGDLNDAVIDEILAEELVDGKWKKRRTRNETWDHLVYGEATMLRPGYAQSRSDMRWVWKGFGVKWPKGGKAASSVEADAATAAVETEAAPPARKRRKAPMRRNKASWIGRLK